MRKIIVIVKTPENNIVRIPEGMEIGDVFDMLVSALHDLTVRQIKEAAKDE